VTSAVPTEMTTSGSITIPSLSSVSARLKVAKGNHDSSEALARQHRKDAAEAFLDGPRHRDSGTAE